LLMGGESGKEFGMPGFDDFSDTGALRFERDRVVDEEIKKGSKDTGRGFDCGCSRLRSDFGKEEDAETSRGCDVDL
jgi:hypothetical protein